MALEKGRVLYLVTTSTSPSLQAYAELHALFSEGVYKPLALCSVWCVFQSVGGGDDGVLALCSVCCVLVVMMRC